MQLESEVMFSLLPRGILTMNFGPGFTTEESCYRYPLGKMTVFTKKLEYPLTKLKNLSLFYQVRSTQAVLKCLQISFPLLRTLLMRPQSTPLYSKEQTLAGSSLQVL